MRLTFAQLSAIVSAYVNPSKIGSTDFTPSTNNLAKLVDRIGKQFTLDGKFYDKLQILDGEDLPLGKTVEEWYQDLILPEDYEDQGEKFGKPAYPSYRKPTYSYSLGRKKFRTTVKYDEYERACDSMEDYARIIAMITKRLSDSETLYRYKIKKQMLGKLTDIVTLAIPDELSAWQNASPNTFDEGQFLTDDDSIHVFVAMKDLNGVSKTLDQAITDGDVVEIHLLNQIKKPVDTLTGEAFIKQVKKDVEEASFITEGTSLSGTVIGAEEGLVLIMRKGIMPSLDVDTFAGAFHAEKLALPAELIIVDDFGDENIINDPGVFAILADKRMMKLHNDYRATRDDKNGDGDFITYTRHSEYTAHLSRFTFVKVYTETGAN